MSREEFNLICKKIEKFKGMLEDEGYSREQRIIIKDNLERYENKRDFFIKDGIVE